MTVPGPDEHPARVIFPLVSGFVAMVQRPGKAAAQRHGTRLTEHMVPRPEEGRLKGEGNVRPGGVVHVAGEYRRLSIELCARSDENRSAARQAPGPDKIRFRISATKLSTGFVPSTT